MEPAKVISTYCRSCGEHYEIYDPPLIDWKGALKRHWRDFKELHIDPPPPRPRWVSCQECGHHQQVTEAARSTICPACGRYMPLGDIIVTTTYSRSIKTRQRVIVRPGAFLESCKVISYGVEVYGLAYSNFECNGEVIVREGGKLGGIIRCSRLTVERGANVEHVNHVEARHLHIDSNAETRNMRAQRITVGPNGRLYGPIHAESFNVEEGGHFEGQLNIAPLDPPLDIPSGADERRPPLIRAPHADTTGLLMHLRPADA
jgi:cytoskeletal protein CcmA (bactofilin family)